MEHHRHLHQRAHPSQAKFAMPENSPPYQNLLGIALKPDAYAGNGFGASAPQGSQTYSAVFVLRCQDVTVRVTFATIPAEHFFPPLLVVLVVNDLLGHRLMEQQQVNQAHV